MLWRSRAIWWVVVVPAPVCGRGGDRISSWCRQYGILRRLANSDQTGEIGSDRKIGYPNGGDTPGITLLAVGSLNSRVDKIVQTGAARKQMPYP